MNLERFLRRGEILKRRAALSEQHHLHVDLLILSIFRFLAISGSKLRDDLSALDPSTDCFRRNLCFTLEELWSE